MKIKKNIYIFEIISYKILQSILDNETQLKLNE